MNESTHHVTSVTYLLTYLLAGARHTLTVPKVGDQLNNQRLAVVVSNDHGVDSCVVDLLTYRGIYCVVPRYL